MVGKELPTLKVGIGLRETNLEVLCEPQILVCDRSMRRPTHVAGRCELAKT